MRFTLIKDLLANPSARRGVYGLLIAATIFGLYTIYWYVMAARIEERVEHWIDARLADGLAVTAQRREVVGFPFDLRLHLDSVEIIDAGAKPWHVSGFDIVAWARTWNLGEITYQSHGMYRWRSGVRGGVRELDVDAGRLGGSLKLLQNGTFHLHLRADDVAVRQANAKIGSFRTLDVDMDWRGHAPDKDGLVSPVSIDLGLDDAFLPDAWRTPLGQEWKNLRLRAAVEGPIGQGKTTEVLNRWRDAGGVLQIMDFSATHGPLSVQADGTAALDAQLQPIAALGVRAEGYLETIDALSDTKVMSPGEATAAKLVLAVIAKRPTNGTPYVETPLTLQDRILSAGDIRLTRLPVVRWWRLGGISLPGVK